MLSRIRLLTQFRLAWQPIFFDVAMPIRPSPGWALNLTVFAETRRPFEKTASNSVLDKPGLRRNLVTSLESTSLQGVLAIGRSHSDAKSVCLTPVTVVGLVGPFHGFKSSLSG